MLFALLSYFSKLHIVVSQTYVQNTACAAVATCNYLWKVNATIPGLSPLKALDKNHAQFYYTTRDTWCKRQIIFYFNNKIQESYKSCDCIFSHKIREIMSQKLLNKELIKTLLLIVQICGCQHSRDCPSNSLVIDLHVPTKVSIFIMFVL